MIQGRKQKRARWFHMRRAVTLGMVLLGLALMTIGFFGSAPWGAYGVANADPRFSFAPLVFVLGVVTVFGSAVAYELLPDQRQR